MSRIVISVENVSKSYRLGIINHGMLYKDLQSWWARVRGKEDPNSIIGLHDGKLNIDAAGHFWALKDISFTVNEGDVLGIIGKNGAGKSTILKILSKVTAPTKGVVKIKGRIASLLEVGTGFHPELTGRENIYLNGAILGMTGKEITRKFDEIVDFAEIEAFIDTPVKRYSSGMYVRLAFAVAAHLEPEILLVDEVLSVGDAEFQKKCLGKMGDVAKKGRTILFVSHNMTAIKQLCHRAILLKSGMIIDDGDSMAVVDSYLSNISASKQLIREYAAAPTKPVQIRRVAVYKHNDEVPDSFDLNESFFIDIDYEFNEIAGNISIGLQIISEENSQCIISLSDPELDLSRLKKRSKGYYRSSVEIPGKILNTGTYRVRVGATSHKHIYDVVEDVNFNIIDNVGIVQSLGYERKNSILSLQLPWKVKLLREHPY